MGIFDRRSSKKKVVKKQRKRSGLSNTPRKGLSRFIPPPPGSGNGSAGTAGTDRRPATRGYSEADILGKSPAAVSGLDQESRGANGRRAAGASVVDKAGEDRFGGLYYKKDGRIGTKDEEENTDSKEIFDAEGLAWYRIILWSFTALAVLGTFALIVVLVNIFIALWPGGEESTSGSGQAEGSEASGDQRAAASAAEGFAESYLTMSAGEGSRDIEQRLAPFVGSSQLASQVAAQSTGEVDRQVLSSSAYRVSQVSDGRYAVSVDALTLTSSGSGASSDDDSGGDGSEDGSSEDGSSGDGGSSLDRQAMKVYVGGSDGNVSVTAPPVAITPPSADEEVAGALNGADSVELTDDALEEHLRGYFSAAYGAADAQGSVEQFFAEDAGMPVGPAEDYTYLDLDGATMYEIPAEEHAERYSAAYRVEAYVNVREESTGSTSYQTHLLEVAHQRGGEWTITDTIGR